MRRFVIEIAPCDRARPRRPAGGVDLSRCALAQPRVHVLEHQAVLSAEPLGEQRARSAGPSHMILAALAVVSDVAHGHQRLDSGHLCPSSTRAHPVRAACASSRAPFVVKGALFRPLRGRLGSDGLEDSRICSRAAFTSQEIGTSLPSRTSVRPGPCPSALAWAEHSCIVDTFGSSYGVRERSGSAFKIAPGRSFSW